MNQSSISQSQSLVKQELRKIFQMLHERTTSIEEVEPRLVEILIEEPQLFKEFPIQTESLCLIAVTKDWTLLPYVRIQTKAICLAAVRTHGLALAHARKQSPEMCQLAISQHPEAIQYVKRQTKTLCLQAIEQDPWVLSLIRFQHKDICLAAYLKDPNVLPLIIRDKHKKYCLNYIETPSMNESI